MPLPPQSAVVNMCTLATIQHIIFHPAGCVFFMHSWCRERDDYRTLVIIITILQAVCVGKFTTHTVIQKESAIHANYMSICVYESERERDLSTMDTAPGPKCIASFINFR